MEYQFSHPQISATLFTNFPLHSGSRLNFRPLVQSLFVCQILREGTDLPFQKEYQTQVVCRWSFGHQWHRGRDNVTFSFSYNLCELFNLNVQSLCSTVTIPTYVLLNVFLNNFITGCVSDSCMCSYTRVSVSRDLMKRTLQMLTGAQF